MADRPQIRQFCEELYPELTSFANTVGLPALLNREFVDHYYLGQDWSKLFLVLKQSECVGILGVDQLQFATQCSPVSVAFGTNFYSLQPGTGGMLWFKWMEMGEVGMVFGGSKDTHRVLAAGKFDYYSGINIYRLNAQFEPFKEDSALKGVAKSMLRPWRRKRLSDYAYKDFLKEFDNVKVIERHDFDEKFLVQDSPFRFRFAPSIDYLRWRYNLRLSYIHYRLFEIIVSGKSGGYCVLNEGPKDLIVAHADGNDPEILAAGVLKSLFRVGEDGSKSRKAEIASSHPAMQLIFCKSGFRLAEKNYPFAVGSRGTLPTGLGSSDEWLVNIGIGDNDLRQKMFWPAQRAG